jgi:hypothetical protein
MTADSETRLFGESHSSQPSLAKMVQHNSPRTEYEAPLHSEDDQHAPAFGYSTGYANTYSTALKEELKDHVPFSSSPPPLPSEGAESPAPMVRGRRCSSFFGKKQLSFDCVLIVRLHCLRPVTQVPS